MELTVVHGGQVRPLEQTTLYEPYGLAYELLLVVWPKVGYTFFAASFSSSPSARFRSYRCLIFSHMPPSSSALMYLQDQPSFIAQ